MTKKRIALSAGGLFVTLVAAMGAYRYYKATAPLRDVLPTFTEAGPGPRAPASDAFGIVIGHHHLPEVQALLRRRGVTCADTSMRALMGKAREEKRAEIAAAKARGEPPDAVTGASMVNRRSPKEANPQVRLSCENVPARVLAAMNEEADPSRGGGDARPSDAEDGGGPSGTGRLLMVFDSPAHPVRHVSFDRTFPAAQTKAALAAFNDGRRKMEARFGRSGGAASGQVGEPTELVWLSPVESQWKFADLGARVTAVHYGARGIVVGETTEVPWPVRADAPAHRLAVTALGDRRGD